MVPPGHPGGTGGSVMLRMFMLWGTENIAHDDALFGNPGHGINRHTSTVQGTHWSEGCREAWVVLRAWTARAPSDTIQRKPPATATNSP
jgi:hypothetical protein